jgi:hypothetical protein
MRPSSVLTPAPVPSESLSDVLALIERPPGGDDARAERRRRAQRLVTAVHGDQDRLEHVRSTYLRRLYRAGGDLGATAALRVVEDAMWLTP